MSIPRFFCTFVTMRKITLITGGARSGKSTYAEKLALQAECPVYMATARIWDKEFADRIRRHQERRGPSWTNIEEEKILSKHSFSQRTILIDCVTLWSTNFFFDAGEDASLDEILADIKEEFEQFTQGDNHYIFVTNEIGLGGTSIDKVQRRFTDLLGWVNQYIASQADEVTFMVSGIPMKIK